MWRENIFVYIVMFDEVDEGIVIFKMVMRKEDIFVEGKNWFYFDIDFVNVFSSDYYF